MMSSQISIENVHFQYPGGETPVLRDVSLTVEKGEFIAIVGGNGSGKSTLCKLLNGLIPHYYVGDYSGSVTVNGKVTTEYKVAELSQQIGYVYQDFDNQIVSPRVLDDASFSPLNYGDPNYIQKGKDALELVGLHGHDDEFIWQLSGGQKHLLALAGALALDPDILIIDEPIAQLDPSHAESLYQILEKLNKERGKTIIVIEHHTEFIANYCQKVVLMEAGQVIWKKDTKEALQLVDELMERQIYPPQVTQAAFLLDQERTEKLPITIEEAEWQFKDQYTVMPKEQKIEQVPLRQEVLVQLENVSFSYQTITRARKQVLKQIDMSVHRGDIIALVGNNGAGKSSLMRLMTGLVKPDAGDVIVQGKNTRKYSPEKLANEVTYIYQNPEEMFIEDSVRKDVEFFLKARNIPNYEQKVDEVLTQFELQDLQTRDGRLMSGGQQRRASLAIGVAMNPSIILLDEPTANLDIATRKHITKLIATLKDKVGAIIIATHDMQLAAELTNRMIVLHNGEVIHDGDRSTVFNHPGILHQAGLVPPQILQLSQNLKMESPTYTVAEFVEAWQRKEDKHGVYA